MNDIGVNVDDTRQAVMRIGRLLDVVGAIIEAAHQEGGLPAFNLECAFRQFVPGNQGGPLARELIAAFLNLTEDPKYRYYGDLWAARTKANNRIRELLAGQKADNIRIDK